jgi:hypothetical protein
MSADSVLDNFDHQGWTDQTKLMLALEYITNQQSDDAWQDFLQEHCTEQYECAECGHGDHPTSECPNKATGPFEYGRCEFCGRTDEGRSIPLVARLVADPDQLVCEVCHADERIPTKALCASPVTTTK